jgi:hypothetical protein
MLFDPCVAQMGMGESRFALSGVSIDAAKHAENN